MSNKRINWTHSRIIELLESFQDELPSRFNERQWLDIVGKKYDVYLGEYTDDIAGMAWTIILFLANNNVLTKISESEYEINHSNLKAMILSWKIHSAKALNIITNENLGESLI